MIVQVVVFNLFYYLCSIIFGEISFEFKDLFIKLLPTNYYVILYGALYLISPYINILTCNLNKKQFQRLITVAFFIFSIWSFGADCLTYFGVDPSLSTISMYGSQDGYTIVNFILLYIIGSYIKKYNLNIDKRKIYIYAVINFLLLCLFSFRTRKAWQYNNPLVILMATYIFVIFSRYNYQNKYINILSKATLTCFLFHYNIVTGINDVIENIIYKNKVGLLLVYFLIPCVLYLCSFIVFILYEAVFGRIRIYLRRADKKDIYKF